MTHEVWNFFGPGPIALGPRPFTHFSFSRHQVFGFVSEVNQKKDPCFPRPGRMKPKKNWDLGIWVVIFLRTKTKKYGYQYFWE